MMRTLADIQVHISFSTVTGLNPDSVRASQQIFGSNSLSPLPREPIWKKFLAKFDEPIIKILLAAALLSMLVDLFEPPAAPVRFTTAGTVIGLAILAIAAAYLRGLAQWIPALLFVIALVLWPVGLVTGHASYDGLAVMVAVVLATGVAFVSEFRSEREFEVLNAQKESLRSKVLRGGEFHTMPIDEVVVGDLVILEMGDEIPADGKLCKATDFYLDQSLMTGESEPAHKFPADSATDGPDQPGCLFRGTQVVDGQGRMIVLEVGDSTYLGQIARRLAATEHDTAAGQEQRVQRKLSIARELTPLQEKLQNLAGLISKVGYAAALAIFLALLVRGILHGEVGQSVGFWKSVAALLHYFMYMVIIIVVAVPEGLPMSVTVSLALAMRKMTRANSLVRQLVACETIGSATVIATDKTGTLTQNRMQVVRLWWDGQLQERGTADFERKWELQSAVQPLDWLILNAAANSTANLEMKNGTLLPVGNSTEGALLQCLHERGIRYQDLRARFEPLYQVHFSSERKRMTTVVLHEGRRVALVKGASEWLLENSVTHLSNSGEVVTWTDESRAAARQAIADSAAQAMRTLAFGFAVLPSGLPTDENELHAHREVLEKELVFAGFVAIRDPLRPDVKEAIAECRAAGIDVMMVTGDNAETARAIAREIDLLDRPDALVMTSQEFAGYSDDELKGRLPRLRVLARAQPLDKYRLVRLLQELGEVVAVTGDGTNDAPALKKADVGLAMGIAGTEVAKEASKIVLLDDAFSTIVKAVHWGRALYENIQRFIQFQLTINASALVIAFLGPFFGVKPPFTILQLLWINVIMDTLAAIALCSEPPRAGLMRMPPKKRGDSILTRAMLRTIGSTAAFFVVVMMTLLILMEPPYCWFAGSGPRSEDFPELTVRQVSIFFTVYVIFQVWNELNCRSLVAETSGVYGVWRNPIFLAIVGLIVVVQVLIVSLAGPLFQVEPLTLLDWLVILAGTATVLAFAEICRRLQKRSASGAA